jgi:hypothetical protein
LGQQKQRRQDHHQEPQQYASSIYIPRHIDIVIVGKRRIEAKEASEKKYEACEWRAFKTSLADHGQTGPYRCGHFHSIK